MSLQELITRAPDADTLALWIERVPSAAYLGIRAEVSDGDILFILPENEKLVGNPSLPALHGAIPFFQRSSIFHSTIYALSDCRMPTRSVS